MGVPAHHAGHKANVREDEGVAGLSAVLDQSPRRRVGIDPQAGRSLSGLEAELDAPAEVDLVLRSKNGVGPHRRWQGGGIASSRPPAVRRDADRRVDLDPEVAQGQDDLCQRVTQAACRDDTYHVGPFQLPSALRVVGQYGHAAGEVITLAHPNVSSISRFPTWQPTARSQSG